MSRKVLVLLATISFIATLSDSTIDTTSVDGNTCKDNWTKGVKRKDSSQDVAPFTYSLHSNYLILVNSNLFPFQIMNSASVGFFRLALSKWFLRATEKRMTTNKTIEEYTDLKYKQALLATLFGLFLLAIIIRCIYDQWSKKACAVKLRPVV
uniref:Uncharacterized protein n=1 Tax=Rhodnius prolixus TaxID=13249 RepID=T1IFS3_RHOPR